MKNQFIFIPLSNGYCTVTFTTNKGKIYATRINDAELLANTRDCEAPLKKHLNTLKKLCKNTNV